MLDRLEGIGLRLSRCVVWCGGAIMIGAAFVIGAEVVLRKIFLVSLGGADEMANYALAISTAWSLSFTLLHRAHIRVDALYLRLPASICAVLDVIALMSLLLFAVLLTWFAYEVWMTSWSFEATANTPLGTPLWIPQGLWLLGLGSFVLTILLLLARSLRAIAGGDFAAVNRIAGTRSVDEDLQEELDAASTLEPGAPGIREQE